MRYASCLSLVLLLAASLAAAPAAPKTADRPTTAIEPKGCVTAECHADVKAYPRLHGPINANACDACHETRDVKAHTFTLMRQKADLCTFCHDFDVSKMPVIHKPVTLGECTGCHDPHGGPTRALLREQNMAALCARCHEDTYSKRKFNHSPIAWGECDSCHQPHASFQPKLVDSRGDDLCLNCHGDFGKAMAAAPFRHKALEQGCNKCHDVHASDQPMALAAAPAELCTNCHEHDKVRNQIEQAVHKHTVVTKDRACLNCHTAHGGDLAKLMAAQPTSVCMDCHKEDVKTPDGRVVASVAEIADPTLIKHGPIREGRCSGCHEPHGGSRPVFLTKTYTNDFYQKFDPSHYALCFSCHDARLASNDPAEQLTNFRNGQTNLHFLHAQESKRGRNCRDCHTTHASRNERNLRETVHFGKWDLPINFTRTATGGTCESGCHLTYSYDREKAIPIPTTGPATGPTTRRSPRITVAEVEKPRPLRWSGRDAQGVEVAAPDEARPMVLMFVRADHDPSREAMKLAATIPPEAGHARVLLFVGGAAAAEQAGKLLLQKPAGWHVVADVGDAMARQANIRSWPTTLVVNPDGLVAAHIAGAPPALAQELAAHLEFASSKIDRDELNRRLTSFAAVDEGPAKKSQRLLRAARQELADGRPDAARRILAEALRLQPDAAAVKSAMARAMIDLKQGNEALKLIAALPAAELPPGEVDLLRARALVSLNRWPDARPALQSALKANPTLSEAHLLMGQLYERENNWQKAAESYRNAAQAR